MSQCVVEFKNVVKSFGDNHVLRDLSLCIPVGKRTFIIGRSGEGKSVTIKHIVGILQPDSGTVWFQGQCLTDCSQRELEAAREKIGLLFQDGALFDSMNVLENVSFPMQDLRTLTEFEKKERAWNSLNLVGLSGSEYKSVQSLSIGEKKRVGLARSIVRNPDLILYDEPTTGMDPLVSDMIDQLIVKLQNENPKMSSVVISHDVSSIMSVAEHIAFLHEGRIYKVGSPEEFRASTDPIIVQFLAGSLEGPLAVPLV
jgi:phospholipid/cholesterol/gamma-HCH transport system ATP-binding protein